MITRDVIRQFWRDLRRRGVDLDREMLWSFYFADESKAKLKRLRADIEQRGYRYVGLLDEAPDDEVYFLQIECVARLSSQALYDRCVQLKTLADDHGVHDLDGFDVGNVDDTVLIPAQ